MTIAGVYFISIFLLALAVMALIYAGIRFQRGDKYLLSLVAGGALLATALFLASLASFTFGYSTGIHAKANSQKQAPVYSPRQWPIRT